MKEFVIILILFFSLVLVSQTDSRREMADLVLLNGTVWTVNPDQPWAEAVALKGDKILEASSSEEIKKMIGNNTQVIDLKGDLVLPGFIDSHTHFLHGGFSLLSIRLRDAESREEFITRIDDKAKEIGKGVWILDGDWDHQSFDPPELPRKEWIDPVTRHNPVCVNRHDGHMVLINSLALKLAGITKNTPTPVGGEILKDPETGEPTGILKDAAMNLVMRHIPEPSFKEKLKAAEVALKHAAEAGVTSIHDMAYAEEFEVYQELLRQNKLTARLYVYILITEVEIYARLKLKTPFGNNLLKIGGLKGFVDGSLGSSTALFFDPYTDNPQKKGLLYSQMFPEGIMEKRIIQADKAGLQVAVHAIGDKANNILLDIFERIITQNGERDRRWRIEHAQHLLPQDIERIANLGIIASIQPYHAIDDGRWAERKIGRKRCQYTYAFKSLVEKGAVLACGSDWTVAPLDPISGIYAAVTRQTLDGKHPEGWFPEQKISLEEAIRGYTLNGAYAEFSENLKGSVEKGKLADLVVLSRNIFKIQPDEIQKTEVKMTIFNGKVIYKK
ncbi:MAG TPA: amidohydrolase [Candidatus Aminicenantes bacterium]|nr:amidohydrolase [Candidatus Aminicenantes bacterium]HEB35010.1 amidohydrolase [Candidatus Aminicenantes bacterium]